MARGRHPRRYAQLGGQRAAEELRELFQGVGKPLWWHVVDDHNNGLASFDNRGDAEAFAAAKRDELSENVYLVRHQSGKAGTLEKAFTVPVRKNPRKPTRKARAFIGRKIRRLAHEGMRAPRRVAAAYSLARRAGFKVPSSKRPQSVKDIAALGKWLRGGAKRARKNPRQRKRGKSESAAWLQVEQDATALLSHTELPPFVHRWAEGLRLLATEMRDQLLLGVHENPTLAVLGNPPAKVVGTLSHRLYELRYQHAEDGKDYRHPFGPGAAVKLLADGSVWITAKHALWKDH